MADKKKRQSHLSDLFKTGEEVSIEDSSGNKYVIWVQRPTSLQQEESREKANGKLARYKLEANAKAGDRYLTLKVAFDEIVEHNDLIDSRMAYLEADLRDVAFNEVLYTEDSEWAGGEYVSLVAAIADRYTEIKIYNDSMKEAGSPERIVEDSDEEFIRLTDRQNEFRVEVDARTKVLVAEARNEFDVKSDDELREELMAEAIDLESKMSWYEAFQNRMLFYACRYNDDRKKFYFENAEDISEIPMYIKNQLYAAYERIEQGSDEIKNSLSLLNSSA